MRKFTHYTTALLLAGAAFFAVSCDDTEELKPTTPEDEYDAVLKVKEDSVPNPNVNVNISATTGETITALVTFVNTGDGMKRLYITQNIAGTGDVAFEPLETTVNLKADGAIGLEASEDEEFSFEFDLPVPDTIVNGTVVYTFWTTTGNGDMRDQSQRLAAGPGTITLKFGTAVDPDQGNAEVKSYEDLKLSAPAADGTSVTFVSLLTGEVYPIKPSGISSPTQDQFDEYISLWDFGYINKTNGGPTLHSTATYPEVAFGSFPQFAASTEEKNNTYFRTSTKTAEEFDAISVSSDLDFITQPTDEFVSNLDAGTVIEFVDQYGKKGMIKVLEAVPGNSPGVNYVRISIKVQP